MGCPRLFQKPRRRRRFRQQVIRAEPLGPPRAQRRVRGGRRWFGLQQAAEHFVQALLADVVVKRQPNRVALNHLGANIVQAAFESDFVPVYAQSGQFGGQKRDVAQRGLRCKNLPPHRPARLVSRHVPGHEPAGALENQQGKQQSRSEGFARSVGRGRQHLYESALQRNKKGGGLSRTPMHRVGGKNIFRKKTEEPPPLVCHDTVNDITHKPFFA